MSQMTYQKRKVLIAVLNQGTIRKDLSACLTELSHQDKYEIAISYPADKPISQNRNRIVQEFLAQKDIDYLIMIDSDIVPPLNILNLVDFQKDIIAPVMFIYQQNSVIPLVVKRDPEGSWIPMEIEKMQGLVECDATGTGCLILSRKVLQAVRHPFRNEYDADGIKKIGLDFNFCKRAKELGFQTYVHLDYFCSHYMTFDLKKIYETVLELKFPDKNIIK